MAFKVLLNAKAKSYSQTDRCIYTPENMAFKVLLNAKANKWTRPQFNDRIYLFGCKSLIADRIILGGTTQHYLAAQQAMMSVHRPAHSKILLAYLANWPLYIDPGEYGFQGALKCQGGPFLGYAQVFSVFIVWKNCQNGLLLRPFQIKALLQGN